MKRRQHWGRWAVGMGAVIVSLAVGCASPPAKPAAAAARPSLAKGTVGRVVRVDPGLGFAVVRGRDLPSDGEEAMVFRGERQVGVVRFAGPTRNEFAAPDIVSGDPQPGDRVVQR